MSLSFVAVWVEDYIKVVCNCVVTCQFYYLSFLKIF